MFMPRTPTSITASSEAQCDKSGIEVERIRSATDWDIVREEIAGKRPPSAIHGEAVYGIEQRR